MSTTLPEPRTELFNAVRDEPEAETVVERSETPDETWLENRFPEWFQVPRVFAVFTLYLGFLFFIASGGLGLLRLAHSDVWGHLSYGRWISETGGVPQTEPLLPLADGVRFVDTAWLSQVLGYGAFQWQGAPALQFLFAASIVGVIALLIYRTYRRTHNATLCLAGSMLLLWLEWKQLIIRPQLAGFFCFGLAFVLVTGRRWSVWKWAAVPAVFALWANLHGSFIVGLGMLGCLFAGRAVDVLRRTKKVAALWRDAQVRRWFLLTELCAAAVLLNPYGLEVYPAVFSVASNLNLSVLLDWQPLTLRMQQGRAFAAAVLILVLLYRVSPRRIPTSEVLLIFGLGAATLWTSRMIVWWAPVAVYSIVLHAAAVWQNLRRGQPRVEPSPSHATWAVVSIGLAWIWFAVTPLAPAMFTGRQPPLVRSVTAYTPVAAAEYIQKHPPQGMVYALHDRADYLQFAGPEGLQVMANTHVHLLPGEVWRHYLQVVNVAADWDAVLERYGVNAVVIDPVELGALANRLNEHNDWQRVFQDRHTVVFYRRKPI